MARVQTLYAYIEAPRLEEGRFLPCLCANDCFPIFKHLGVAVTNLVVQDDCLPIYKHQVAR